MLLVRLTEAITRIPYTNNRVMNNKKNTMTTGVLLALLFSCSFIFSFGQTKRISWEPQIQDSICKYGRKYDRPERIDIYFPAKKVSKRYKIKELHKAIPDSLNNEDNDKWWYYDYYFVSKLLDYDPKRDRTFTPRQNNFRYKLKDTYFFDINGDGLLDFVHYPKYYMAIVREVDAYELFIQEKSGGYTWITFWGFIIDITFNKHGSLNRMKTYQGACCDDNQATFYSYTFDKSKNDLALTKREQILTCQLIKK